MQTSQPHSQHFKALAFPSSFSIKRRKDLAADSDSESVSIPSSRNCMPSRKSKAIRKSKISSRALQPLQLKFKALNKAKRVPLNQAKSQPRLLHETAFLYAPVEEGLDIVQIGKRDSDIQKATPVHELGQSRVMEALLVDSVLNQSEEADQMSLHETNSRIKNFQHLSKMPSLNQRGNVEIDHSKEAAPLRQQVEEQLDDMLFSDDDCDRPPLTLPTRNTTTESEHVVAFDFNQLAEKKKGFVEDHASESAMTTGSRISPIIVPPSRPTVAAPNIRELFFMQEEVTPQFEESAMNRREDDLDSLLLGTPKAPAMRQGLSMNWLQQDNEMSEQAADLAQCRSLFSKAFNLGEKPNVNGQNNASQENQKFNPSPAEEALEFTERRRSSASLFDGSMTPENASPEALSSLASSSLLGGNQAFHLKKTTSAGKPENNSQHQTHATSILQLEASNSWMLDRR